MNISVKHAIVFCILIVNTYGHSQDSYMDKVDAFRKSFYSNFFVTGINPDNYLYKTVQETNYSVSTGDSLEKPRKVELWGMQYFKQRHIPIKTKLKLSELPKTKVTQEDSYFLFIRKDGKYYNYLDTLVNGDLTPEYEAREMYLDSLIRSDMTKSAVDPANQLFVYSALSRKRKKTYYLSSHKHTVLLQFRIKRKDLRFLKERQVPVEELEMWAISHLFGQYCDHGDHYCLELYPH